MNTKNLLRTSIFGVLILVFAWANTGCYYRYGYYGPRYGYSHRVYVPSPPPRAYYYHRPQGHYNSRYNRNYYSHRNDNYNRSNRSRGGGRYYGSGDRHR